MIITNEKNKTPLVSIIMAGYKSRVDFLQLSLDSIKNQDYKNIELIFVDDGCSEEALNIIKSYNDSIPVKVLHNSVNIGLPKSLNKGLSLATGKYIARFDDDDIMLPQRISMQVDFLETNKEYVGCWTEFEIIDQLGTVIGKSHVGNRDFVKQFISKGNCCCHSSLFIRSDILNELNGYNEKFLYAQDLELYTRLVKKYKMKCIEKYLVQFRQNSTRNPLDKQILSFVFSYSAALEYVNQNRDFKSIWYIFIRTLRMVKFALFDVLKLRGSINGDG